MGRTKVATRSHRVSTMMIGALAAALFASGVGVALTSAPAVADLPATPSGEFYAPECAGTTLEDPKNQVPPGGDNASDPNFVPNLTRIWGERLEQYNTGNIVVLYDSFGGNQLNGYPAVCGTRYVDGIGAVSEWMFCTDIFSHVCSGVNGEGSLVNADGDRIDGVAPVESNPKLDADKEKIIAWLIQHGYPYAQGFGDYDWGVTEATAHGDSMSRSALQTLVWCISDPVAADASGSELDRQQTCEASMSTSMQDAILAQIPDDPTITLALSGGGTTLEVGDTATFSLTTNLYNQPIKLNLSGPAGTLSVSSGATYEAAAGELTITGENPAVSTTVTVTFTASAVGEFTLAAVGLPAGREHIGWSQSPGVSESGTPCQVYATFHEVLKEPVEGSASVDFAAKATSTPTPTTPTPTETAPSTTAAPTTDSATPTAVQTALANTGASQPLGLAAVAGVLALVGTVLVARLRLRKN